MTKTRELEAYLRRLRWSLAELPEAECAEIIAETRAHVQERLDQGAALRDVLEEFGSAEQFARTFLDERQLVGAIGSQRSLDLMSAVAQRANSSIIAFAALTLLILLSMAALIAIVITCMKLVDPVHVGLWISEKQKFLGIIDDPTSAHEVLGNWIHPFAAAVIAVAWLAGRFVLSSAVSGLIKSERKKGSR